MSCVARRSSVTRDWKVLIGWAISRTGGTRHTSTTACPPEAVTALRGLTEAGVDAQALADRVFRLMRVARFDNLCNAEAVGIIRSDDGFRRRFDVRLDELLARR